MKKNNLLHILFAGCVFFTVSCKFNSNKNTNEFNVSTLDSLPYEVFTLDTTDMNCKGKFKYCPNAKISYPIFNTKDSSLNDYLNAEIKKMLLFKTDSSSYLTTNDYLKNYFDDNRRMRNDGNDDDESSAWEIEGNINVITKNGNYISVALTNYIYAGGVHPNTNIIYRTYDLVNKKPLKIDDLLNVDDTSLLRIGEHHFRKDNGIKDTTKLTDAMFFVFGDGEDFEDGPNYGKFRFNDNFSLTKEGVEFYYNTYEIGPYAVGAAGLTIPYSEIKPFLKLTIW